MDRKQPSHEPEQPSPRPIVTPSWLTAVRAAEAKKALDIRVLDLRPVTTFADFFLICSGANPRQIQAVADEIGQQLKQHGELPVSVEGYDNAEWVLMDYGDLVVHVFSEKTRTYFDLERLWRPAKAMEIPPEGPLEEKQAS